MTKEEAKRSIFMFDDGPKLIGECDRDELLTIIGYQFETLQMTRDTLDKTFKLLKAGSA